MRRTDFRDWSKEALEQNSEWLQAKVDAGEVGLIPELRAVKALIPHAPPYHIVHRD